MNMRKVLPWLAWLRKALAAAAGLAATLLAANLLSGDAAIVAQVVLGVAAVAGVAGVRNAPRPDRPGDRP